MADLQGSTESILGSCAHLESANQDSKTNPPKRFYEADGLEVDQATNAPQIAYNSGPQVALSRDPLITLDGPYEKEAAPFNGGSGLGPAARRLSRRAWIILIASTVLVLAISIGAGVGVGINVSKKSSASNTNPAPTATFISATSSTTSAAASSTPLTLEHGILDDSSFAAVSSSDGSKCVIFQDISGALRQVYYSQTAKSWASDDSLTIPNTTDARLHTPLSAVVDSNPLAVGKESADEIFLFYISTDNVLSTRWYVAGAWATPQQTAFVNLSSFNVYPTSRSLSVTTLPNTNNSEFLVYFEGPEGTVTALHGSKNLNGSEVIDDIPASNSNPFWTWKNITAELQSSAPNVTFGAPFFNGFTNTSYTRVNRSSGLQPQAVFFDPEHRFAFLSVYNNANSTFETAVPLDLVHAFGSSTSPSSIENSDFVPGALYSFYPYDPTFAVGPNGYWVNGTTFSFLQPGLSDALVAPKSFFPFTRMATMLGANDGSYSLFHQFNASILAEDVWDAGLSSWTSFNISISTS